MKTNTSLERFYSANGQSLLVCDQTIKQPNNEYDDCPKKYVWDILCDKHNGNPAYKQLAQRNAEITVEINAMIANAIIVKITPMTLCHILCLFVVVA
jgi:hypothetical protein